MCFKGKVCPKMLSGNNVKNMDILHSKPGEGGGGGGERTSKIF